MPRNRGAKNCTISPWLSANLDCKESRGFIQVGNSLLLSKKFQALRSSTQMLYLCMAMESGGNREFKFSKGTMTKFGLNRSTAVKGIEALIEAGFIKKDSSGKNTREPNKYEFINEWKMKPPLK